MQGPPLGNFTIPIYQRNSKSFIEKDSFLDFTGTTLLHLCNCILYDFENQRYTLGKLEEPIHFEKSTDLKDFYGKYSKTSKISFFASFCS